MHLEQGQVWKKGDEYLRIVTWERMAIEYKAMTDPEAGEGPVQRATKKEFCRMIKGASLLVPEAPSAPAES
jgi:hypothetical protein